MREKNVFTTQSEAIVRAREIATDALPKDASSEPFWKSFTGKVDNLPDTVFERLPEDAASEHDHYLYGTPQKKKRVSAFFADIFDWIALTNKRDSAHRAVMEFTAAHP